MLARTVPPVSTMTPHGLFVALAVLIVQSSAVFREDIIKSSLTFVIDDTGSMWNEIEQVKQEANKIFDKVLSSNSSQIENFILVTFNDPYAKLRVITKDRDEFKRALNSISVDGGGDCPEYAMKGIELALTESMDLSYLYVFTDAAAADYTRFDHIKSISQRKQSQVVFVLTGDCGDENSENYKVYNKVAEATAGQVFHMEKDDIKDILLYVEETITSRGVTLVNTKLPPGYGRTITYPIDARTGDVLITVTGKKPKIGEVTGPGGSKPATEHLSEKDRAAIVKVTGAKPGDHEVEVGSKSETHAVITAKTSVNFRLGFSTFRPTTFKDSVTRPAPDGKTYLAVKLIGEGVMLDTAKILDMSDNVITELPLTLVDKTEQFYLTPAFEPPNTMFRVSVSGYDLMTKTPITRKAPTPIERQNPSTEEKKNLAPEVTLDGASKIVAEYDEPLQLKCKVRGYPQPEIHWTERESGIALPAKISVVEVPFDYVSILDIDKAKQNMTYQCKAANSLGVSIKYVAVETKRKFYFDVIEKPKDIRIQYMKEGKLVCNVDAFPPVIITWYKDGKEIPRDANIEKSSNNSIVTIKHMQPHLEGTYVCEARNLLERKVYHAYVKIFGLEKPIIDKSRDQIRVKEGTDAELTCRIVKGTPEPTINWYYRKPNQESISSLETVNEKITLRNVSPNQAGLYTCTAANVAGSDGFTIELIVEYAPKLKDYADDRKILMVKDGDEVRLPCDVTGQPDPSVEWYHNGTKLEDTEKTRIASNHSLKFRATIADSGYYTCKAQNTLGSVKRVVFVNVFIPVKIDIPKVRTIETMVGKNMMLGCRADGYPRPGIKWTFHSSDKKIPPKDVTPTDGTESVVLRNIQLNQQGYYTCVADNGVSIPSNITYEVKVYAPPIIENVYADKTFVAVEGDPELRIQCKATGSPTPTIVWKKDDLNVAIRPEWYNVEADGTLVIKNIDTAAGGTYVCVAENKLGTDTEIYDVQVTSVPIAGTPTSTVFVEEGETVDIKCNVPHNHTDQLRWYKNGLLVAIEELTLYDVTRYDDGLYTCRVSGLHKSRSATTKVVVGFKPTFITVEEETIDFVHGADVEFLVCEAVGEPKPKHASWKHNGKPINITSLTYPLEMALGNTGIYECEVSNEFGSIHRTFNVTSRDCILNIKTDFPEKQPIMVSSSLTWPDFQINDGYMIIPENDYFYLSCPSQFASFTSRTNIMAFCVRDNIVRINGGTYNFADIKCKQAVKPNVKKSGIPCLPGNTEYVQIGYKVHRFVGVYDVCLDKDNNVTLFTKQHLSPYHADSSTKSKWSSRYLPQDFDSIYDCRNQVFYFSPKPLGTLRSDKVCCFGRRQLVNSRNLLPGIPTSASFDYLNVIPHWSTCNSKNWDDMEERVRRLAKTAGRDLIITTGTANPRVIGSSDIRLRDHWGGDQPVARFLWKLVQDPPSSASLAIIQVNVPELSTTEAWKYVVCNDICDLIDWMKGSDWNNVENGYTYCCTISEFEKAFNYTGRFSPGMKHVLFDASLIPDLYLTK